MQQKYTALQLEDTDWRDISGYIHDRALANFLGVEIINVTIASMTPQVSKHSTLQKAIVQKYSHDKLIQRWIKYTPPEQIDEILDWIESDLITRN